MLVARILPALLASTVAPSLALGQSWRVLPTTVPNEAAAWDGARQRLLLVGSDSEQRMFEWDGMDARERPGELAGHRVVQHLFYDPAHGLRALSMDRFVGQWTGAAWTWHNGGSPPPVDLQSSVAFDAARQRLVVITGGDVHEWDGQQWWVAGSPVPGIEAGAAFAYDPATQRCLLYGGGFSYSSDTWSWDGFAWTQLPGASQPGARYRASMALEPNSQRLVLYGGSLTASDTWQWDGSVWTQLPTTTDPGPQLQSHFVATDQDMLLLPTAGSGDGEIWRFANGAWSRADALTRAPQHRTRTGFAYDFIRETLVGFGGDQGGFPPPQYQTLLFDRRWTRLLPATAPALRHSAHMAWSTFDQKVLMFGGQFQAIALGDTWTWNGIDWESRQPSQSPSPRVGAVMARDPAGGVMLFGGTDGTNYFGDHWLWNGTDWQQQTPATLPAARAYAIHAYDPVRAEVLMFAGLSTVLWTETWIWDGIDWTQQTTTVLPSFVFTAAFRPESGRIITMGQNSAFEWSGTDWTPRPGLQHGQPFTPWLATHFGRSQLLLFQTPTVRQLTGLPASTETYGTNCAIGPAPALTTIDHPAPGSTFTIEVATRAASAPTLLAVGLAAQNVQLGNGCRSLVGMQLGAFFAPANAGGIARFPFPLPHDLSLRGVQFTAQGAVWNPAASPLGSATLTAGIRVTIGD